MIIVKDDGHGMTRDECIDEYLVIGRDRRKEEGDMSREYKGRRRRRLMSRKGIGKLAGFGIANRIEVRTVSRRRVTHFALSFDEIVRSGKFVDEYEPEELADDGKRVKERNGTEITLTEITISRAIPGDQFRRSMARRFTVLTGDESFRVLLNKKEIKRDEQPFQFRYPPKKRGWNSEKVPGAGEIKWWAGFRAVPIRDEEARGIAVIARGKLAQTPWFFDLSGGAHGQHGLQYLTGEVQADFLDATDGPDLVATDRGSVLWEEPAPEVLRRWGEKKIKELLDDWVKRRTARKTSRPVVKKYMSLAERLPAGDRRIFYEFVNRVTGIPQLDDDEEILDQLVEFGYNALTNRRFFEVIRQLNAASPEDRDQVVEILAEWDVLEAVQTAQKVRGRVEIIRKFEEMIEAGVPEKPDMQEFLKTHPWLIDPMWEMLQHERSLDTVLVKQFHAKKVKRQGGASRLDFFCLATSREWEVVELKRPGARVSTKELDQIRNYVLFLREHAKKTTDPRKRADRVGGILVYSDIRDGTAELRNMLEQNGIYTRTWQDLLRTTERLHKEFLDVVKRRAPANDPRIEALDELD